MITCATCQLHTNESYNFCPRCGNAFINPALGPSPAECVHERYGVMAYCYKCGERTYSDETLSRKYENKQYMIWAGVCAFIALIAIIVGSPEIYRPGQGRLYSQLVLPAMAVAGASLLGFSYCLFKIKFSGERD